MLSTGVDFAAGGLAEIVALIERGGPVAAALGVMSIVALAVAITKFIELVRVGTGASAASGQALQMWHRGQCEAAMDLLSQQRMPAAAVLGRTMRAAARGETALRDRASAIAGAAIARLRHNLRVLEVIVGIAPLVGLFGTVLGMIDAFQSLHVGGADVDPAALAGGIWVALITTALGLGVAIPTSMALGWFDGRIEAERTEMETVLTAFLSGGDAMDEQAPRREAPLGVGGEQLRHAD